MKTKMLADLEICISACTFNIDMSTKTAITINFSKNI